jgi:hypothetical protein
MAPTRDLIAGGCAVVVCDMDVLPRAVVVRGQAASVHLWYDEAICHAPAARPTRKRRVGIE